MSMRVTSMNSTRNSNRMRNRYRHTNSNDKRVRNSNIASKLD